jgi:hypothetical protein
LRTRGKIVRHQQQDRLRRRRGPRCSQAGRAPDLFSRAEKRNAGRGLFGRNRYGGGSLTTKAAGAAGEKQAGEP